MSDDDNYRQLRRCGYCDGPTQHDDSSVWCPKCKDGFQYIATAVGLKQYTLTVEQRLAWTQLMAIQTPPTETPAPPPNEPKLDKLSVALALLRKHPDWSDKKIAQKANCSPAYLSQNKTYRIARDAIKGFGQETQHRSSRYRGTDMDEYDDDEF